MCPAYVSEENTSLNLVQIGGVAEENEHTDRCRDRHDEAIVLSLSAYIQICKNTQ